MCGDPRAPFENTLMETLSYVTSVAVPHAQDPEAQTVGPSTIRAESFQDASRDTSSKTVESEITVW